MSTRIIRALFLIACVIMGGLWSNYLVTRYNDRVLLPTSIDMTRAALHRDTRGEDTAELIQEMNDWLIPRKLVPVIVFLGSAFGGLVALSIMYGMRFVTQEAFDRFFPALVSVVLAMATGWFLAWYILQIWNTQDQYIPIFIQATMVIIFAFIGVNLGLTRASSWETLVHAVRREQFTGRSPKLLDTSVIIDGRIADVCKIGFIEGTIVLPRFVLHELQMIADSSDMLRRARGRRGLDVLKQLQSADSGVTVEVIEDDPPNVREVDGKLVALAKQFDAKIITNDMNLAKVAQIDNISVMNFNDLVNALKTVVLPEEHMQVRIVREGKEPQQGVGYLDDGTMVVVDGGKEHIGHSVAAIVTSVLQTANGRMIFTKLQSVLE